MVDRNGKLLASSILTSSVYANPKMIKNPVAVAQKLKQIFPGLDEAQLIAKLKSPKSFVWIKRLITPTEHQLVNDAGLLGLYFETNERRAYTYGRLFSHVIGNVGLDGEGLSGIEKSFDSHLRQSKSDGINAPLVLSVDASLQSIVREELQNAMTEFSAKGGVGIVQDPNNGEILALISLPDFNPHAITKDAENDVFNKATLGTYEVGSVFKPFTVAAALDSNKVRLNDVYDVDAPIQFANYHIKDFQKKKAWLSVPEILMYSSNIGTAQIALELGKKNQFNYLKAFGFLESSAIEMTEKSRPLYPTANKWSDLSSITISYGNGISVSPLHVVNAMSALVNGGKLYPATIIKTSGEVGYVRAIKESTSDVMRKLLRLIVKHGSGRKSDVEGYFVGGKTGTSNVVVNGKYSNSARISSFVGAFPIHSPKFVIYIMLDDPKSTKDTYGFATAGWNAAPVVSKIIRRMTILYNMLPELSQKEKIEQGLHINYSPTKAL
jgi:cell division protein FtsI (penicillin-binding protein 3)